MKNFLVMVAAVVVGISIVSFVYGKIHERKRDHYMSAAYITQGTASAIPYKLAIQEYYLQTGKLPCSDDDLPDRPQALAVQALRSVAITACGQITLTFNELSGVNGGTLTYEAAENPAPTGRPLNWRCHSDTFEDIATLIPQCKGLNDSTDGASSPETHPVASANPG